MIIRQAIPADAKKLVELIKHVEDSGTMLFEPGERKTTAEQFKKRIEVADENSAIFLAEEQDRLNGYLFAVGENLIRKSHSVYVAIGVRDGQRGTGIGTKLFTALANWAADKGLHRIELTVMEHNEAGIALYKKMGFEVEGRKRDSLLVDGNYVDELYMAKIL